MDKIRELENISNPFNKAPVYYVDKTGSTMRLAEEYCFSSVPPDSGTVFFAGMQTAGRGRVPGRIWEASEGANLLFTLVLSGTDKKKESFSGNNPLPIVIGLGISKYLEKCHQVNSAIKWPNDILVNDRKIAGIIIESKNNFFNIGIGLNINQTEFPYLPVDSATSLSFEKNKNYNLFLELELVLHQLKKTLVLDSWHKEITARLYNPGKEVSISTGIPGQERTITGVIEGIGSSGQLLIRSKNTLLEIYSGEIKQ